MILIRAMALALKPPLRALAREEAPGAEEPTRPVPQHHPFPFQLCRCEIFTADHLTLLASRSQSRSNPGLQNHRVTRRKRAPDYQRSRPPATKIHEAEKRTRTFL